MVLTYRAVRKDQDIYFQPYFLHDPVFEKFSDVHKVQNTSDLIDDKGNT